MQEDNHTRITLRIPKDLVHQVNRAAFSTSKSQNAEIIGRLRASFEPSRTAALPDLVEEAVIEEMKARGGTETEALTRLVLAGKKQGGTFFFATIYGKTTVEEFTTALEASKKVIPPDTTIIVEHGHPNGH